MYFCCRRLGRLGLMLACCVLCALAVAGETTDQAVPGKTSNLALKLESQLSVVNNPLRPEPSANVSAETARVGTKEVVGEGDQLLVTVFGQPDLSADVVVGNTGSVTLPLVGQVAVRGKTIGEISALFSERLEQGQYLRNPQVSVKVVQQNSRSFSVLGEVLRPGHYPLQRDLNVLDALSVAGGVTVRADKAMHIVRREEGRDGAVVRIPLRLDTDSGYWMGQLTQSIQPYDVLVVASQKNFYVYGEVRKPGAYPIEEDLNVMRVLSIGGGVTDKGSTRRIVIHRKSDAGAVREIPAGLTDPVLPGDVVFINERIF